VNPIPLLVRVAVYGGCALLFVGSLKGCHDSLVAKGDKQGEARERGVWVAKELRRSQDEAAERARLDHQKEDSDRETRRLQERAQAERAAADVAAGKLRSDLAAFVAAAKRAGPAAVGERPPADSALDLLADLQSRIDARAGELADYADAARIAGQQCERDYDALSLTHPRP
jgi:hypothetical protein